MRLTPIATISICLLLGGIGSTLNAAIFGVEISAHTGSDAHVTVPETNEVSYSGLDSASHRSAHVDCSGLDRLYLRLSVSE